MDDLLMSSVTSQSNEWETSDQIVLSICIPTFNRAAMLSALLVELDRPGFLPFRFEVIVVDNASTDPDYAAIEGYAPNNYRFSFYRRSVGVAPLANMIGALRLAEGAYCLYLADDDRLVPDVVVEIVQELELDPGAAVMFAAWQAYDLIEGRVIHNSYAYEPARIEAGDTAALARLMVTRSMMIPENGIYRTRAAHACLFPSISLCDPVIHLERLSYFGAVRFYGRAFINLVWRHPADPDTIRVTLGTSLGSMYWHRMWHSFAAFYQAATGEMLHVVSDPIVEKSIIGYAGNALLDARSQLRRLEAWEQLRVLRGLFGDSMISPTDAMEIAFIASLQAVRLAAGSVPGTDCVVLEGFDQESASSILGFPSAEPGPRFVYGDAVDFTRAAILAPTDMIAASCQALHGILPGRVFSIETMRRHFRY